MVNTHCYLEHLVFNGSVVYSARNKRLSKGCWDPKRKMWVTMHFSETIKVFLEAKVTLFKSVHFLAL